MKRRDAISVLNGILERDLIIDTGNCMYMSLMKQPASSALAETYEIHFRMPLDTSSKVFLRDFVENHGLSVEEAEDGLIIICEPQVKA